MPWMSYSAVGSGEAEVNGKDHSATDGELVERRKHSLPDPMEELSQLAEEGQGRRRRCKEKKILVNVPSFTPFLFT